MAENEATPLPHFQSLPELVEYFDAHDMGEHWDGMPEAQFQSISRESIAWFPLMKT